MAVQFEETHRYLDKESFTILLIALAATDIFMAVCYAVGWVEELWMPLVIIAVTAVGALMGFLLRLTVVVEDGEIRVRFFIRTLRYPQKRILDVKKGDIDILRDYSGWGHGTKVRYRTYSIPGIDDAVSVKLGGKEVLTLSTERMDELYDLVYSLRRQD